MIVALVCTSCTSLSQNRTDEVVARVGDSYLYKKEMENDFSAQEKPKDSLNWASDYINHWAVQELLMQKALTNISDEKKAEFEKLVTKYRQALYGRYYKEEILNQIIDTLVSPSEMKEIYQQNKETLKLNEDLIKLRYIQLDPKRNVGIKKLEERFKSYSPKDRAILDSLSIHFISSFLNDTVWVKAYRVFEKLPFLEGKVSQRWIKHEDSTGLYLVKINDYLYRNQQAPMEYVSPILKQIILNRRKVEQESDFEQELIQKAIEKKQFERYE